MLPLTPYPYIKQAQMESNHHIVGQSHVRLTVTLWAYIKRHSCVRIRIRTEILNSKSLRLNHLTILMI